MRRLEIVKKKDQWRAESGGRAMPGTTAARKEDAVKKTAQKARASREPVTVRIHGRDGRIQEERTYPRGADPRKSRG